MAAGRKFVDLHLKKFNIFKSQNPESGRFDVVFKIEGKLLYAHKIMLILESETFDVMLSDRWSKKDEPIKITSCSYDNFYQFLIFLYSGYCKLNGSNINEMVDIAEFYGVEIFKDYCDEYLSDMTITVENVFQLIDLAEKYSMNQLKSSAHCYITKNFTAVIASEEFLKVTKYFLKEYVISHKYISEPEDLMCGVYKWCEKQAKNKTAADPNINLRDSIKNEISEFLPHIVFRGMDSRFLHELLFFHSFVFSSGTEIDKILSDRNRFFEGNVKITNNRGQTLHGNVSPDKTVLQNIESLKSSICYFGYDVCCWWETRFKRPSTPSPLKKKEDVQWYLLHDSSGNIGVKYYTVIYKDDYLLAELTPEDSGFDTAEGCKIE